MTPPLGKECPPSNFRPMGTAGTGYSSSDSLERSHSQQLRNHNGDAAPPAPTPKLSGISGSMADDTSSVDASARTSSSRDHPGHSGELSLSDAETEWAEQDVPGVYITIRALPGGGRELRRVRFRSATPT